MSIAILIRSTDGVNTLVQVGLGQKIKWDINDVSVSLCLMLMGNLVVGGVLQMGTMTLWKLLLMV